MKKTYVNTNSVPTSVTFNSLMLTGFLAEEDNPEVSVFDVVDVETIHTRQH